MQRVGGMIQVSANGVIYSAKGNFSWNLGRPKREVVMGSDGKPAGYKETPQPGFLEGKFTDRGDISVETLVGLVNATVTLELANGKVLVWRDACYAGDGNGDTEEGEIDAKFEGIGEEVA